MVRGRRFLVQLGLLPILYLLSLPDPILFTTAIALVLLVSPTITGTVASLLIWSSRQAPSIETLRERADDAATSFLQSLAAAFVGGLVILTRLGFTFPGRPSLALLAWLLLLISVPAIGWLGTWRNVWLPKLRQARKKGDSDAP